MAATAVQPGWQTATAERIRRLMETADLSPPGLPPAATLIVRRLGDPLPGRLMLEPDSAVVARAWEQAARTALADCARRAGRPAAGFVADSAEAVLFADDAELLAALALDARAGLAGGRWWWRALAAARSGGGAVSLAEAWCRQARAVPAALAILSERRAATDVVEALGSDGAPQVLRAVIDAFELNAAWADASRRAASPPRRARAAGVVRPDHRGGGAVDPAAGTATAAWSRPQPGAATAGGARSGIP